MAARSAERFRADFLCREPSAILAVATALLTVTTAAIAIAIASRESIVPHTTQASHVTIGHTRPAPGDSDG